ncbi:MAG TPA: gamma carbonic anhydrase family protein [Actinomycetales bacterium]|jgi:carbonic anhydrase/acetyltransferase-like protein (isoleucine patch superfamily)|nr:gamma carbonic anhydrase family protein [Actinomycetales bacterium]
MNGAVIRRVGDHLPDVDPSAWVAPGAIVAGQVTIGADASIWYGCVIRADREAIRIGDRVNVQDLSCLHSDPGERTVLEDDVTIGHRAVVHGAHVGAGALVGIGAVVLGGARIGEGALVAAGAVVRPGDDIPAGHLVAGIPAKVIRPLTDAERAVLRDTPGEYVATARLHRDAQ